MMSAPVIESLVDISSFPHSLRPVAADRVQGHLVASLPQANVLLPRNSSSFIQTVGVGLRSTSQQLDDRAAFHMASQDHSLQQSDHAVPPYLESPSSSPATSPRLVQSLSTQVSSTTRTPTSPTTNKVNNLDQRKTTGRIPTSPDSQRHSLGGSGSPPSAFAVYTQTSPPTSNGRSLPPLTDVLTQPRRDTEATQGRTKVPAKNSRLNDLAHIAAQASTSSSSTTTTPTPASYGFVPFLTPGNAPAANNSMTPSPSPSPSGPSPSTTPYVLGAPPFMFYSAGAASSSNGSLQPGTIPAGGGLISTPYGFIPTMSMPMPMQMQMGMPMQMLPYPLAFARPPAANQSNGGGVGSSGPMNAVPGGIVYAMAGMPTKPVSAPTINSPSGPMQHSTGSHSSSSSSSSSSPSSPTQTHSSGSVSSSSSSERMAPNFNGNYNFSLKASPDVTVPRERASRKGKSPKGDKADRREFKFKYHMSLTPELRESLGTKIEPKKRRKARARITGRICAHCGASKTSEWRMGPEGRGTLCNACGLRYRKKLKADTARGGPNNTIPMSMLLNATREEDGEKATDVSKGTTSAKHPAKREKASDEEEDPGNTDVRPMTS